ncbi:hypothetical protein IMZ16_06850 [Cruoricaptor ignavus]|uniref:Virus attachment protein p12 family protein n=1 Tax=Cruoricaptor ignavus TaxID=1118202 RepID=A0A7M1T295_9FLAO|nr:hypothetical protein [Cruoricaptor ignavus]QOR73254.1 hypothetical protein IMZ16_06850 [Cruoricaptor ignavus]
MMETSLLIQYIIVGLLVLSAFYAIFRVFRKNFSPKKFSKKGGCEDNCGCGN